MFDRKEFLVHFHSDGLRDCHLTVTMGLTKVAGIDPAHLPLQVGARSQSRCLPSLRCCPLPIAARGWCIC